MLRRVICLLRMSRHKGPRPIALLPLVLHNLQGVTVKQVPTKPYEGQKTGTSGLRKKTKEFMQENYLANWVQSLFNALGDEVKGQTLGLGGDGRYFGKEGAQIIIKLAAGNGFKKVVVGQDALMATPAASALIRRRKLYGENVARARMRSTRVQGYRRMASTSRSTDPWGCQR